PSWLFSNDTATTGISTLSLHDALPICDHDVRWLQAIADRTGLAADNAQLYVDAISRLERLSALRSVGLAITGSPDLRLTLRVILDRKSTRLNSSHLVSSYAVFCLKKKT